MDNKETKSAATTSDNSGNNPPAKDAGNGLLKSSAGTLMSMHFMEEWLGNDCASVLSFSRTCKAARAISSEALKKSLLTAVAEGNEALAREMVSSSPELLLDKSATVKDISGKEIKNLTPLQAAICAGDVEMVQMMVDVLNQKQQGQTKLSFNPAQEIQNQFAEIYPNGIEAVVTVQMAAAQKFKDSELNVIFNAINTATPEQIRFELHTPGLHKPDGPLNTALHNLRTQFTDLSNQELIFNPYDLLAAFEFYDAQFNNFSGNENTQWDKRDLFWRQVIGFVQRHLPACYLQAFAQGIYYIVENHEKLKRDFEVRYDKGSLMRPSGDLNGLGYKWAVGAIGGRLRGTWSLTWARAALAVVGAGGPSGGGAASKIIADKNSRFSELIYARSELATNPSLPAEPVRNFVKYSCCNIC